MADKRKFSVLVIDDEIELIRSFKLALGDHWDVEGLTDPAELERDMKTGFTKFKIFDLIFLDLLFDKSKMVTKENAREYLDREDLLGIQFLKWIQKNYSHPIVVLSGNLFSDVASKLHEDFPYILLKSKPVDLYATDFRHNMEWYAQTYFKKKVEDLFDKPLRKEIERLQGLLDKSVKR